MKRTFIFTAEVPYWKISIQQAKLFFEKSGYAVECDGNKKVVKLRFLFKEVKFSV